MNTEVVNQELSIIEKSVDIFKQGGPVLLANQQRSAKAVIVGQNIINEIREKGMTPELDERAMKYLVNCSKALKEENENRSAITQLMDEIKKMFTSAEALIDVKREGTCANIIQAERNNYAKEVAEEKKRKEEEARIKAEKEKEAIDFRADMEMKMFEYYSEFLIKAKTKLLNNFNTLTLSTISAIKDTLDSWQPEYPAEHIKAFKMGNYSKHLTTEEVQGFIDAAVNAKYQEFKSNYAAEMNLQKQEVIDRIPSKIAELQEEKRRADQAEADRKEAQRIADEAEKERQKKMAAEKDEAARKALEAQQEQERQAEKDRIAKLEQEQKDAELKAEQDRKNREEEEQRKILQEQEEARKDAEIKTSLKKEGEKTMVLFEQESASATDTEAPETRTGFEIEVTHQAGYVQLFTLWFEQEGKKLPLDKIDKTSFGQIRAWAEKLAHKNGEKIESKFIIYKDSYKAVNRKAKS